MKRCEMMTRACALAAMAVLSAAGCGQKRDVAPADGPGSEAVAQVNGDPLTVAQLQLAMQKLRGMHPEMGDAASRQVLDQLIDEQIVAQKAVAAKLDQDPRVLQQIEAARRDILVHRFLEAAAETAGKPSADAVQKFYDGHPALFAQRKVYTLEHLDIQAPAPRRADVDAHVRSLKTAAELADWLRSQKLPFSTRQEQAAAEQLPPAVLGQLATMKDGESMEMPSPEGVSALTLVSSASVPKSFADARPAIEQFLGNQGRRELILNLQKTIRDGAKVAYLGRFAASAPAALPVPAASAASQNISSQK